MEYRRDVSDVFGLGIVTGWSTCTISNRYTLFSLLSGQYGRLLVAKAKEYKERCHEVNGKEALELECKLAHRYVRSHPLLTVLFIPVKRKEALQRALALLLENDKLCQQMGNAFGLTLTPRSVGDVFRELGDVEGAQEVCSSLFIVAGSLVC